MRTGALVKDIRISVSCRSIADDLRQSGSGRRFRLRNGLCKHINWTVPTLICPIQYTMVSIGLIALATVASAAPTERLSLDDLYVTDPPSSVRPYVIPHLSEANGITIGSQAYRFYITGPSSGYAFTLMGTSAPGSSALGVLPHIHQTHYENFYNFKGRYQLWAQGADDKTQAARQLTAGDYGSVPRNTTHTFQILDPDTEMTGVIVPGGFEDLFYALGTNFTWATNTPYKPEVVNDSAAAGPDSSGISGLEKFDVYAQLDFNPRRDLVNGSAPNDSTWHTCNNTLGSKVGEPYFVANGYGPKYLNSQYGYQIVQPLVGLDQSADVNYTLSTISINGARNRTEDGAPTFKTGAAGFQIVEGVLNLKIGDYPVATLYEGDVAFIPANTTYKYWSPVAFTKVLYVASGSNGVDQQLIGKGKEWGFVTFPTA
uniref:ARAD1D38214p n=1 Tax=Blastobotrys adeninivorans TaxID=409370 RepID=A0A060TCB3_BLAAD